MEEYMQAQPGMIQRYEEPKRSLVKKLAEIMGEVKRVPKSGRNNSQGYNYATEADIAEAVREAMAKRSVMMLPSVEKTEWSEIPTRSGGKLRLCTSTVRFTLEDGDSGETRSFVQIGEGTDSGDKASYKAMTGAEKYALMKLFLIPTGDDPEKDDKTEGERIAEEPAPYKKPIEEEAREQIWGGKLSPEQEAPDPVMKFGKAKGKKASELTDAGLSWYLKAARESVEKNDPKWHKANVAFLGALTAEADRRGAGHG